MSFLNEFEGRIGSVFGAAPQGYTEPFSFKKLAKKAAKEMERETYEIDGRDTAPALYTILVSSSDDSLMRPLYAQITKETSAFVQAEAKKKGYVFVGKPLVRFMVDPTLRSGKFAVFAENIDSFTLTRLREEEQAFLGGNSVAGGAAARVPRQGGKNERVSTGAAQFQQNSMPSPMPLGSEGLDIIPSDYYDAPEPVAAAGASTPMPVAPAPLVSAAAAPSAIPMPVTQRRNVPLVDPASAQAAVPSYNQVSQPVYSQADDLFAPAGIESRAAGAAVAGAAAGAGVAAAGAAVAAAVAQPQAQAAPANRAVAPTPYAQPVTPQAPAIPTCLLIDRQTGRTFTGQAPTTVIGRERSQAGIVLRDPNVSRRHAELHYDGANWHIIDLNSTNGTLVNDVDVDQVTLRDGDLITVGLVNLEFRENH